MMGAKVQRVLLPAAAISIPAAVAIRVWQRGGWSTQADLEQGNGALPTGRGSGMQPGEPPSLLPRLLAKLEVFAGDQAGQTSGKWIVAATAAVATPGLGAGLAYGLVKLRREGEVFGSLHRQGALLGLQALAIASVIVVAGGLAGRQAVFSALNVEDTEGFIRDMRCAITLRTTLLYLYDSLCRAACSIRMPAEAARWESRVIPLRDGLAPQVAAFAQRCQALVDWLGLPALAEEYLVSPVREEDYGELSSA